jgi:hypothetical protein
MLLVRVKQRVPVRPVAVEIVVVGNVIFLYRRIITHGKGEVVVRADKRTPDTAGKC